MRSQAREAAFKIVFAREFGGDCDGRFEANIYHKEGLGEEDRAFAHKLVGLVNEHKEELLAVLDEKVERFAQYRIYTADRAILLLALAEIKYVDDVPPVVSVSEAAGLARKYSTESSASFVNGVLGGIINQ